MDFFFTFARIESAGCVEVFAGSVSGIVFRFEDKAVTMTYLIELELTDIIPH